MYSTTPVVSYDNLIDTISHDIKILLQGVIVKSINNIIASSEDLKNEIRILSNDIATLHYRDIPQILRRIETLFEMYNKYNLRERIATLQLKLQQVPKHSIPPSVPVTR